jgi:hypothetical protein
VHHAIDLYVLAHDQRKGRAEDDDGAGDVAKDHSSLTPEGKCNQPTDRRSDGQFENNPGPAKIGHPA